MSENALFFGVIILAAVGLQVVTTLIQYRFVHRRFTEIKRRNQMTAVGKAGSRVSNKTAVLAFDAEGCLNEAYILSGFSVFARLKEITGHEGKHYSEIKKAYIDNRKMRCIINAIQYVEVQ